MWFCVVMCMGGTSHLHVSHVVVCFQCQSGGVVRFVMSVCVVVLV